MEEGARRVAALLKQLANENRLLIVCALIERPMSVGELGRRVPAITQSALSQHLSLLKACGILDSVKAGQSCTYSIADRRVEEVIRVLKHHYCADTANT